MTARTEWTAALPGTPARDPARETWHRRHHSAAFWVVAAAFCLNLAFSAVPTPLYAIYQQRDHFSTLMITVVYAVYAVGVIASLFLGGHVSDWVGRRRVLVPLYTVVVGTRGSAALERRRVWMAADWAYRIATPSLLRRTKSLEPWAVKLEELEEIRDEATLKAARELIYKCREASWDARREALASLRRRFSAVADADAVADAVADVAAVADAVAAADVAAAAVADADAVAVAVAWRRIFDAAKSVKGDYWAKRQAADPVARKVIDQIRPGRLAWRDKLDDDFGQLVRRMAALTEADAA